ncbi:MAG: vgr related protein [Sphingobium sp.]
MGEDGRPLTSGEKSLAGGIFGQAIEYTKVRIHRRKYWPLQPRRVAMAPDGHLWLHPDGGLFCNDYAAQSIALQALFIHEMTHVWQAQRSGKWWLPLMRHPFCSYDYKIEPGKLFARYGIEQQAEIVKHAFMLRQGITVSAKPPLSVYEALLPFPVS